MARKTRKKKRRLPKLPVNRLLGEVGRSLASGNTKNALKLLRRAQFLGASEVSLGPLWVRAHLLRASELEGRGLHAEATAARGKAAEFGGDNLDPDPEDIAQHVRLLPDDQAFSMYAKYQAKHAANPDAEVILAERLILSRRWKLLGQLDEDRRFRRDAAVVESAAEVLDGGEWERGEKLLEPLGDGSAFRHWSAFVTAMAAHLRDASEAIGPALDQVPREFPLKATVKLLRATAKKRRHRFPKSMRTTAGLLGLERTGPAAEASRIRKAFRNANISQVVRGIRRLAAEADPIDPKRTVQHLVTALATDEKYQEFYRSPSPVDLVDMAGLGGKHMQGELLTAVQGMAYLPLAPVQVELIHEFLQRIKWFFPDRLSQQVARGRVLRELGAQVSTLGFWELTGELREEFEFLLGDSARVDPWSAGQADFAAAFYRASVKAHPGDAEAHRELISALQRSYAASRKDLVEAYENFANAVPGDPTPWIALAELHIGRGAYRMAETALAKCRKIAGNDSRVIELQVVSWLVAVMRNTKAGRLHLAVRDLDSAKSAAIVTTEPLVLASAILLRFMQEGRKASRSVCIEVLRSAALVVRAKAMCCLPAMCFRAGLETSVTESLVLDDLIREYVLDVCEQAPRELHLLVEPAPDAFYGIVSPAYRKVSLIELWPEILGAVPDATMFSVFRAAVECEAWEPLRSELSRRLARTRDRTRSRILMIYLCAAKFFHGTGQSGLDGLRRVSASIPEEEVRRARASARLLAKAVRRVRGGHPFAIALERVGSEGRTDF